MKSENELIDDARAMAEYRNSPGTRVGIDLERECVYWPNGTKSEFMRIALGKAGVTARDTMKFKNAYKPSMPRGAIYAFPSKRDSTAGLLAVLIGAMILGGLVLIMSLVGG